MTIRYTLPAFALIIGMVFGAYLFVENRALGSVTVGNEYNARQITASGTSTIKTMPGAIGSIVVASSTPTGAVSFYATTTTATSSADLIFSIPANVDEGTYTYDVSFGKGLLIDVGNGFVGNYVMTWR